ncbi:ABC transporter permease [candidate division KSB1 bacterium]
MESKKIKLPFPAFKLLKLFSYYNNEFDIVADSTDLYDITFKNAGKLKANLWLFRQVLLSMIHYFKFRIYWSIIMFRNYLKIAMRNIGRNKSYSFINITGLCLGIASCLLILAYVNFEFSFDKYHRNANRIYRFAASGTQYGDEYSVAGIPALASEYLSNNIPEIENITRFAKPRFDTYRYKDRQYRENGMLYADNSVFEIFDFKLIEGDPGKALEAPYTIVLTAETAVKYFGREDPVGKKIRCRESFDLTVTGIIKKVPVNSHLQFDGLISMETVKKVFMHRYESPNHFEFYTYLLMKEGYNIKTLESKLTGFFNEQFGDFLNPLGRKLGVLMQPLTSIHLRSNLLYDTPGNVNILYIYGLLTGAVFILLIASVNYVNLSTVRLSRRAKEIGMRKVLGAFKEQIAVQFFGESVFSVFIAFILSIVLVIIAFPHLQQLSGYNLNISFLKDPMLLFESFLILLFISFAASWYPSFFISGFKPVNTLKGVLAKGKRRSIVRNSLVVFQFLISISLIIVTLGVFNQIDFLKTKGFGFDKELLLYAPVYTDDMGFGSEKVDKWVSSIKGELHALTGVSNASFSVNIPGEFYYTLPFVPEGLPLEKSFKAIRYDVEDNFLNTLGINIISGRGFLKEFKNDRDHSFIINETAAKLCGWENPVGKKLKGEDGAQTWTVVGVAEDFNARSLHDEMDPIVFSNFPHFHYIVIRIKPENINNTLTQIKNVWDRFEPAHPFEYMFMDEKIDNLYNSEVKLERIVRVFTLLAVIISCLGIFGFISYITEQRTKEIGIRKTFGASAFNIVNIFVKNLAVWVIIANILAFPIGYYITNRWLENFAYRINVGWKIFILSGLTAFMLAMLTVVFQTVRAAAANPVDSLRDE